MQDLSTGEFNPAIRVYRNTFDMIGFSVPLAAVVKRIKTGENGLKQLTAECNDYAVNKPEKYKGLKTERLIATTFSGTFSYRSTKHLDKHSGLVTIDIDGLPKSEIQVLLAEISQLPSVALAFISPSGQGIKAIFRVDPIPTDANDHKDAYFAVVATLNALVEFYKFDIDQSGSDASRLCYLAYDPHAIVNTQPLPIGWDRTARPSEPDTEAPNAEGHPNETQWNGDIDVSALEFISPDCDYEVWVGIGFACYHAGLPCEVWDQWSSTGKDYKAGECVNKWKSFGNYTGKPITWGSVIHRAKANGYVPKPSRKRTAPAILKHLPDYTPTAAEIETLQALNAQSVRDWEKSTRGAPKDKQHLLVMGTGAGTGKSTATRTILTSFVDVSPLTALADEKYEDACKRKRNAMRHRSRLYNADVLAETTPERARIGLDASKGETPCVYPHECNKLAEKGYQPVKAFCAVRCQRFEECKAYGFLCQFEKMKNFSEIYLSFQDDIFSDPYFRPLVDTISKGKPKHFVMVLDEVSPQDLPPKRAYHTETLKRLALDYKGHDAGFFLETLLQETHTITARDTTPSEQVRVSQEWTEAVKNVLARFEDTDLQSIDTELQAIPVVVEFTHAENPPKDLRGYDLYCAFARITYRGKTKDVVVRNAEVPAEVFYVLNTTGYESVSHRILPREGWQKGKSYPVLLTIDTFCQIGLGSLDSPADVAKLPSRLNNFTEDLKAFVESVKSETPPCYQEYETETQNTPTGWAYHLKPGMNARRGILINASKVIPEIIELYKETEIEVTAIEGKPPKWKAGNALIQLSTGRYTPRQSLFDREAGGLRARGRELLEIIATEAKALPEKLHLIVLPKTLTAEGSLSELPEVKALLEMPNTEVTNHHKAVGVNSYEEYDNAFIFHYEPLPSVIVNNARIIHRNKTLDFTREQTTLEKDGLILERVNRYTDPRVQAVYDAECEQRIYQVMARLRPMLYTGKRIYLLTAEPVSNVPVTPSLPTIEDLKACQAEYRTLERLEAYLHAKADRSVKETEAKEGVSERTAYRRKKQQRAEKRTELTAEARSLREKGLSQTAIGTELGLSRQQVRTLLG